jgi:hypothetical protein
MIKKGIHSMQAKRTLRSRQAGSPSRPPTTKLDDVRAKVRNFILRPASIADFYDDLRKAASADELSAHPLTGTQFRTIITQVIRTRKINAHKRKEHTERKNTTP